MNLTEYKEYFKNIPLGDAWMVLCGESRSAYGGVVEICPISVEKVELSQPIRDIFLDYKSGRFGAIYATKEEAENFIKKNRQKARKGYFIRIEDVEF